MNDNLKYRSGDGIAPEYGQSVDAADVPFSKTHPRKSLNAANGLGIIKQPLPRTTDDEAYTRVIVGPNGRKRLAELPDGLLTDGTWRRHVDPRDGQ